MTCRHGHPYANILLDPEALRRAVTRHRRERGLMAGRIARGIVSIAGLNTDRRP